MPDIETFEKISVFFKQLGESHKNADFLDFMPP